jgi:hypothetical protein
VRWNGEQGECDNGECSTVARKRKRDWKGRLGDKGGLIKEGEG